MMDPSGHPRPQVGLVAMVAVVALVAAACASNGATGGSSSTSGPSPVPSVDGTLLPGSPTALPTFDLATFQTLLTQLHGTPVLVNIWASWCGPCKEEAPSLAALAREYDGRVQFVGIDVQDQPAPARAFIQRYGWIYPSVADPSGSIQSGLGFVGVPVTVVFDAAGEQAYLVSGTINADLATLRSKLDAAIGSAGTGSP